MISLSNLSNQVCFDSKKNSFLTEFEKADFSKISHTYTFPQEEQNYGSWHERLRKKSVPSSEFSKELVDKTRAAALKTITNHSGSLQFERIVIDVNGTLIDGVKILNPKAKEGRWMAKCLGNGQLYESYLQYLPLLKEESERFHANIILFNYPGVGLSTGRTTLNQMVNAYKGVLNFLEESGLAKEIIGHGFSIGGGVQGEALKTYTFKPETKTCFIQDRTFSQASEVARRFFCFGYDNPIGWCASSAVKSANWNFDAAPPDSLLNRTIVIQNGNPIPFFCGKNNPRAASDGVIKANASLADFFLKNKKKEELPFLVIIQASGSKQYGVHHSEPFADVIQTSIPYQEEGTNQFIQIPTLCEELLSEKKEPELQNLKNAINSRYQLRKKIFSYRKV